MISIYAIGMQTLFLFATAGIMHFFNNAFRLAILFSGLISLCSQFFDPADRAILKSACPTDKELNGLISKVSIVDQFVNVAGTAISGLLLTFLASFKVIYVCSFLSLSGSFLLIFALDKVKNARYSNSDKNNGKYYKQVLKGYAFIKRDQFLKHYFWSSFLYSFVTPAMVILLPRIAQEFKKPTIYSEFYLCFILGFIAGSILAGKMKIKRSTIGIAWVFSAAPLIFMIFFSRNWLIFSLLILIFGLMTSIHNILSESLVQIVSKDKILGRILTTIKTGTSVGGPISSLFSGFLLDNSGSSLLIGICSVLILIGGLNILVIKDFQQK